MKTKPDSGDGRAVAVTPPGIPRPDSSILLRIARIMFWIMIAKLIEKVAQNDFVRRCLRRLFPKFHSKINETIIDV
jgi:hypothetical protein